MNGAGTGAGAIVRTMSQKGGCGGFGRLRRDILRSKTWFSRFHCVRLS